MGWVEDHKGAGPWAFSPQSDKYGYLNNRNWTKDSRAVAFSKLVGNPIDLTNKHQPCGHWHKGDIIVGGGVGVGLYSTGYGYEGGLGLGSGIEQVSIFTRIGTDTDWIAIGTGGYQSFAIKSSGKLYAWGYNANYGVGYLGLGGELSEEIIWVPTQVGIDVNWKDVKGGRTHAIGLKTNGTIWATGANNYGQLGVGDNVSRTEFAQAGSGSNWVTVNTGNSSWHNCAIRADGTLWAAGYNNAGQLGQGDMTNQNSFVQIGSDSTWIVVSLGERHTLAIKSDGTLWATGSNLKGQLGLGDNVSRTSLTQVGSGTDWADCIGGEYYSYAVKSNGTLWATGENDLGQLGQGDTVNTNAFVQVGTAAEWEDIALGQSGSHAMCINASEELWGTGWNGYGQIGLNDENDRDELARVVLPTPSVGWITTACGLAHTIALKSLEESLEDVAVGTDEPQVWPM